MKKALSLLLAVLICLSAIFASTASAADKQTYSVDVSNKKVLLIQDADPWDSKANQSVLNKLGVEYTIIGTTEITVEHILNSDMIIISNDQGFSTYENFKNFKEQLDNFVNVGGVIIYGAADSGWASGKIQTDLPGSVKEEHLYSQRNYIVDSTHPIVTGVLTDKKAITNNDLYGNYCSHNYFTEETLPEGANVILRSSSNNKPTLIEYPLGGGFVIGSTLTWEHNYVHAGSGYGHFAEKALDDLFVYGLSLCDRGVDPNPNPNPNPDIGPGGPTLSNKMQIGEDNNSFSHTKELFFNKNEKEKYLIGDEYFDKIINHTNNLFKKCVLIQNRNSKWGGSCFGITSTMALHFNRGIDINSFIDGDVNKYHNAPNPKDDTNFRSLINYYQLAQYLDVIEKRTVRVKVDDHENFRNEARLIVELAQNAERSGVPFIFNFGWSYEKLEKGFSLFNPNKMVWKKDTGGHAIACVGAQSNPGGGYQLQFVDPNAKYDYIYADVPADFSDIVFRNFYVSRNYHNYRLTRIGHITLSSLNEIDIDGPHNNWNGNARTLRAQPKMMANAKTNYYDGSVDSFIINSNSELEIIADDGKKLIYKDGDFSGDLAIRNIQYYEKGRTMDMEVKVDKHASYSIKALSDKTNISVCNSDTSFYAVESQNVNNIDINMGNSIAVEGKNMQCKTYYAIGGQNTDMISVSNDKCDSISISNNGNEVVVKGDNLENSYVEGFCDSDQYGIPANAENGEMKINKNNEIPNIDRIEINTNPTKLLYKQGEALILDGMSINVYNTDGTVAVVDDVNQIRALGYDSQKFGPQKVTVEYNGFTEEIKVYKYPTLKQIIDYVTSIVQKIVIEIDKIIKK